MAPISVLEFECYPYGMEMGADSFLRYFLAALPAR
jgi:hypothetical protein